MPEQPSNEPQFDYVIVGAGSAGAVLARRLLDAGKTVCLVESGGKDSSPFIGLPVGFIKTLRNPKLTWRYRSDPGEGINGRKLPMPHGRVLGGTSAVNGMVFVRGQPEDYDEWEQEGNPGWGYPDVLPYFKKMERRIGPGDPDYRGFDGPQPVSDSDWRDPLCDAFIQSAGSIGVPFNPDANAGDQFGANYYQRAIADQKRVTSARGWLKPVLRHPKLRLMLDTHVSRIFFYGRRATGIAYIERERGGREGQISAGEVILSAGALASPKLLQISGIGPGALLQDLGIPVQHDLRGVGENLRDHYSVRVIVRAKDGTTTLNQQVRGPRIAVEAAKWLIGKPSALGIIPALCHAFGKSSSGLNRPDIAVMFTPASYKGGVLGVLDDFPGMTFGAWQMRPQSKGYVRARTPDAFDLPSVQPNYLEHETDQLLTIAAQRFALELCRAQPITGYVEEILAPGPEVVTDDQLLEFARSSGTTACHLIGSCRMGPASDPFAVVDAQLRVHGMEGLRVVDASIMPTMPSGNTNAPTLMIAERAADLILGRTPA